MRKHLPRIAAWATAISAVVFAAFAVFAVISFFQYQQAETFEMQREILGRRSDLTLTLGVILPVLLGSYYTWRYTRPRTSDRSHGHNQA
ncbi:hypothetical protein [Arthrobacter castelli]|uniref:hypothetical protein n=1 Tax=Arthrobacter castelli TaxID=271431 RepID=UPI00041BF8CC|nr:hypothetical protein [Arthrobacter castelli]